MGGTIKVSSEENFGTEVLMTFKFKLCEDSESTLETGKFKGLHCLVVNDRPNICRTVDASLKGEGLRYDLSHRMLALSNVSKNPALQRMITS